jgi:Bacterial RNA polymerase, alpha chain C terminal domain
MRQVRERPIVAVSTEPEATVEHTDWSEWPEMPGMWCSLSRFHERLNWTEPWVHELAASDLRFVPIREAMTTAMVTVELLTILHRQSSMWFATAILDGRAAQSTAPAGPLGRGRRRKWQRRRLRAGLEAVFDVWRDADDASNELRRTAARVRRDRACDPRLRPIVRTMVAAAFTIDTLCRSIWEAFGEDTATTWSERPSTGPTIGDLEVLGLSDQTVRCLRAAAVPAVNELIVATEMELLALPNLSRSMVDEIGDRLVATGFVPPEGRATLFRTVRVGEIVSDDGEEIGVEHGRAGHESADQARPGDNRKGT